MLKTRESSEIQISNFFGAPINRAEALNSTLDLEDCSVSGNTENKEERFLTCQMADAL